MKKLGGKDGILALENAQLQSVMSSDNIVYGLTRLFFDQQFGIWNPRSGDNFQFQNCRKGGDAASCAVQILMTPLLSGPWFVILVTIDTIGLPIELLASAITGF